MKLTTLLLLYSFLGLQANDNYSQKTKITLDMENVTMREVIDNIESITNFRFIYKTKYVDLNRKVSLNVQQEHINTILNNLLYNTETAYKVRGVQVILKQKKWKTKVPTSEKEAIEDQDDMLVSGTITDKDGVPLPGATVIEKGKDNGVVTDFDGNFSIEVAPQDAILVVSYLGFTTKEIVVNGQTNHTIVLEEDVAGLEEVIVVGYGTQSRTKISTAISTLDIEALENVPYTNVANGLIGEVAGLRVLSTSGQPGQGPRIVLRGGNSINDPNGATPLYLVDGIIRANLDDIASEDIATLSVLKDAAATAIYGARASNGVVLVTTKSGKAGVVKVNYSYNLSYGDEGQSPKEYTNARQYIEAGRLGILAGAQNDPSLLGLLTQDRGYGTGGDLTNNTMNTTQFLTDANRHKLDEGWQSLIDPLDPSKTIIFSDTNFQDLSLVTAVSQRHFLSLSGGTEEAVFNIGVGYLDGQGTRHSTDYSRLSLNLNGTLKVNEKLKVTGRVLFSDVTDHDRTHGDSRIFYRVPAYPASAKLYNEDGTLNTGPSFKNGNPLYYQTGPGKPIFENNSDNLTLGLSANYKILPGLSFAPQLSLSTRESQSDRFQPAYYEKFLRWNDSRETEFSWSKSKRYQLDAVFNYVKSFADHNFDAVAGFTYFEIQSNDLWTGGEGGLSDKVQTLNGAADIWEVDNVRSQFITQGVFSRINYDYKGKYLVSLTARYDGASNLGSNNRWGFFPGISAGWNLHQEDFWKEKLSSLSMKLRASYGVNGNISGLGPYQAQGSYRVGSQYVGNAAAIPRNIPNQNLGWEESRTFDVGMDLGLFNHRVNILFDIYDKTTDNLLTNVALPPSSGFSSTLTNFGSLKNTGVEIELNASVLSNNSPVQWNASFVWAHVKTTVESLPDNGVENNRQGGTFIWDESIGAGAWFGGLQEGQRIGDLFAYEQIGIYANDAEAANAPVDVSLNTTDKTKYGGDVEYLDRNNDGILDGLDRVYAGNVFPTVTGGFSNTVTYKNFKLIVRTDFTLGHTIQNAPRQFANGQLQGDLMPFQDFWLKSWKQEGDITNTPRYVYADRQGNINKNSTYWEKADFLALREVTLAYNLPTNFVDRLKLSDVRFNITGANLYYFTDYQGLNPEGPVRDDGRSRGDFPNPRSITFSVNISF